MDAPYYTVMVTSITGGWSYAYTHGDEPDPDEDVHLADDLTYAWGFENGVVPGQLVPGVVTVNLWCRAAGRIPAVQLGDFVEVKIRIGAAGPVILNPVLRVAAAEVELTPEEDDDYAAQLTLSLVDILAELRGIFPNTPLGSPAGTYGGISYSARDQARRYWRPRLAEIATLTGRSIGCPTWWGAEDVHPGTVNGVTNTSDYFGLAYVSPSAGNWDGKTAHQLVTELLNSHQPSGFTHAIAPYYGSSYPTGYGKVAPAGTEYGGTEAEPIPADPASTLRYLLVPASRNVGGHSLLELDGDWVHVPARARRSREHVVNTLRLGGRAAVANPDDPLLLFSLPDVVVEYVNAADQVPYGVSARDLPTALRLYDYPNNVPDDIQMVEPALVAANFLTDASARDAPWTYNTFELRSSLIPQADAEDILPLIAPRVPGETDGDGQLLRHVTLTNLDPSVAFGLWTLDIFGNETFDAYDVTGFITAGTLRIAGGDLVWNLTLTPGEPV